MLGVSNWRDVVFAEPIFLWLLLIPAVLGVVWSWRVARRWSNLRQYLRKRAPSPIAHYPKLGDWSFWLCMLMAMSACIVALARPQIRLTRTHGTSADFVILQDGSASMYARDVDPDRWQRSVKFLRAFANALSWKGDRVALALFAHLAAPQLRLTKDPNAFFFFLDHLRTHSPFRLEDDPTWDTNIEEGVYWGLKVVEADERLFGKSGNPKAFVVISDGQAWSGDVARAITMARSRGVIVHVIGIGTAAGAVIPVESGALQDEAPVRAVLDRASLRTIAQAGGGDYFEIGREPDRDLAFRLISSVRRLAGTTTMEETREDVYWHLLLAAAMVLGLGTLFVKTRMELWWQIVMLAVAIVLLVRA